MSETFLVTGGSGFIGTWVLKELLALGHRVVVYDVANGGARWDRLLGPIAGQIKVVKGDILDEGKLGRVIDVCNVSHIVHLAAWLTPQCQADPYRGCEINVLGTMRLFELARQRPGRIRGFSYARSIGVYGRDIEDEDSGASAENSDMSEPETFYGAFKRAGELIAKQYWLHYGIPSVGLRPFVIYGPGREHGLTAGATLAARAVARGEPHIFAYSGATGYEFVADTARAFVRAALEISEGCHAVDLPGTPADVAEIVAVLESLSPGAADLLTVDGGPLPYPVAPNEYTIDRLFPDWRSTTLKDGFRRTLEFYRNQAVGTSV